MSQQLGHSADVQMRLMLNGYTLPITHMGPDFLRLQSTIEHAPASGEIILVVDGHESRWTVYLPEGVRPNGDRIPVNRN